MKALSTIRVTGTGLALAAILAAGAVPAQAADPACKWPNASGFTVLIDDEVACDRPGFSITQVTPSTVGTHITITGSGFAAGETVNVKDREGLYNMATTAAADGTIRIDWAVPDYSPGAGIMLSAEGVTSNYRTQSFQVKQQAVVVDSSGRDGLIRGWYPGEELVITVDGQSYPSRYAAADGTSDSFPDAADGRLEVAGRQSGGFFSRISLGRPSGNIQTPPVTLEPEVPVVAVPVVEVPVLKLDTNPVPEPAPEAPVELVPAAAPVPTPARPQPQAAVSPEADAASTGMAAAGGTAAVVLLSLAAFLGVRRVRAAKPRIQ